MEEEKINPDFTIESKHKIREYDDIRAEVSDEAFWAEKGVDSLHIIQEKLRKLQGLLV